GLQGHREVGEGLLRLGLEVALADELAALVHGDLVGDVGRLAPGRGDHVRPAMGGTAPRRGQELRPRGPCPRWLKMVAPEAGTDKRIQESLRLVLRSLPHTAGLPLPGRPGGLGGDSCRCRNGTVDPVVGPSENALRPTADECPIVTRTSGCGAT